MTKSTPEILKEAVRIADDGLARCPVNSPKGRGVPFNEPCPRCGATSDNPLVCVMDLANEKAVAMVRAALAEMAPNESSECTNCDGFGRVHAEIGFIEVCDECGDERGHK